MDRGGGRDSDGRPAERGRARREQGNRGVRSNAPGEGSSRAAEAGRPALIGLCLLLLGCASSTARPDPPPHSPPRPASREPFRFFAASSFWNTPLSPSAPLDPESGRLIGALDAEVASEQALKSGPWINTTSYSVPIYTVSVRAANGGGDGSLGRAPAALRGLGARFRYRRTLMPASGSDPQLVIWQPSTDRLWEFWRLAARRQRLAGILGRRDAPRLRRLGRLWPRGLARSAVKLGGLGLLALDRRRADHARRSAVAARSTTRLSIALPEIRAGRLCLTGQADRRHQLRARWHCPEGAHLRLDPTLNLATLHLPRLTRMIAEAAQRYGIFVRDRTANIAFYAQDPITARGRSLHRTGRLFRRQVPHPAARQLPLEPPSAAEDGAARPGLQAFGRVGVGSRPQSDQDRLILLSAATALRRSENEQLAAEALAASVSWSRSLSNSPIRRLLATLGPRLIELAGEGQPRSSLPWWRRRQEQRADRSIAAS